MSAGRSRDRACQDMSDPVPSTTARISPRSVAPPPSTILGTESKTSSSSRPLDPIPERPLTADTEVRRTSHQASCILGEEAVVLQLDSGIYHGLNPVAARVWELIEASRTVAGIVDVLLDEYEVERGRCEADVENLLVAMREAGLVEFCDGGPP